MKIVLIGHKRNFANYEKQRMQNECKKQGINLLMVDPDYCSVSISENNMRVIYEGRELPTFDYVLLRVGCTIDRHIVHVINALQYNGSIISNPVEESKIFADKFLLHQNLVKIGVPTINSLKCKNDVILNYYDYPHVLKANTGSFGIGTYLVKSEDELKNMTSQIQVLDRRHDYLMQQFVDFEFGQDLRVFVIDKKIVGVMKRKSDGIDFKANYTIHNNCEQYETDEQIQKIVAKITAEFKFDILGIDLLKVEEGYLVCEINSAPGFKGFESAFNEINIPNLLMKMIKRKVSSK